jgi:hypothetical protein
LIKVSDVFDFVENCTYTHGEHGHAKREGLGEKHIEQAYEGIEE